MNKVLSAHMQQQIDHGCEEYIKLLFIKVREPRNISRNFEWGQLIWGFLYEKMLYTDDHYLF